MKISETHRNLVLLWVVLAAALFFGIRYGSVQMNVSDIHKSLGFVSIDWWGALGISTILSLAFMGLLDFLKMERKNQQNAGFLWFAIGTLLFIISRVWAAFIAVHIIVDATRTDTILIPGTEIWGVAIISAILVMVITGVKKIMKKEG